MRIEKLVYGGAGLARPEGRVTLVPFTLPGEDVEVEQTGTAGGVVHARLINVIEPAPGRITPKCPYFARCGGCHYQHAPYAYQLEAKRSILIETFRRVGKIELELPIEVIAGPEWEYRNRAQFHIVNGEIGFWEAGSHRLCPIEYCPVSSPTVNQALGRLRNMMREPRFPSFLREIEVFTNETDVQVNVLESQQRVARWFFEWAGSVDRIEYSAAGETFRVGARSFFQVNRFLVDRLVHEAIAEADGGSACDLYAGVGLFAVPLGRRVATVVAVEGNAAAAGDLRANVRRSGSAVRSVTSSTEAFLDSPGMRPDFILADPPRAGLGKKVTAQLAQLRAPRVTIVSCDPATLARDVAMLVGAGYRIHAVTLIDLFPQTYHIESIVRLRLE